MSLNPFDHVPGGVVGLVLLLAVAFGYLVSLHFRK